MDPFYFGNIYRFSSQVDIPNFAKVGYAILDLASMVERARPQD